MKRSEFLRTGLLALVAAGIGTDLLLPKPESHIRKGFSFKVSNALLKDPVAFNKTFKELTGDFSSQDLESYQIGYMDDDFANDLQTVILTYKL